jgi:NAD(P)-dependent dehydrogenase (short-subunit alcohol dehydrogenase family)
MDLGLSGRVAIVTGASKGIGKGIATALAQEGASLAICARTPGPLESAAEELRSYGVQVFARPADVSQPDAVTRFVQETLDCFGRIDILVNNAGIYGPKGTVDDVDWGEWARAMEINLNGSVLMCRAVLPHMKRQRKGKIVQLSGGGATKPLPRLSAYAVSKAAVVRFAETLAEEVREYNIDVNAIAPGSLNTRMLDEILEAGPTAVGKEFYDRAVEQARAGGTPLAKGADLAVYLASSLSDGITGKLIAAVWDPWPSLGEHKDDLQSTDIYTLRRILPKDRGKKWGSDQ